MSVFSRLERLIRGRRREAGAATAGVLVVLVVALSLVFRARPSPWPSASAEARRFVEAIVETGAVQSRQLRLYGSTIPGGPAKVVEIAAEGSAVRTGDVLVRFDSTRFEQSLETARAELRQAQAELERTQEEERLETLRGQVDLDAAREQIATAERSLANQVEGRGRVVVLEAETALADAERELVSAQRTVNDLEPLLAERFITRAEFDRASQALAHADDQVKLARARRDSLSRFEGPAAASKARTDVSAASEGFARQRESVAARVATRQAMVRAASSRVEEIRGRIDILIDQIAHATVRAESDGLVVYRDLFFGADRRKPQVGDEVFPNQPIIALPDSSQLVVETRIREVDLHKVTASQNVEVTVDAYPDLRLPARVDFVGALAQEDPAHAGAKFFPVTIGLAKTDDRLRTGMTATVEIQVSSFPSVVVVPIESVFDADGQRYVVGVRGGQPERRLVTIAGTNESLAAISNGVVAGDQVLLVDPTSAAKSVR